MAVVFGTWECVLPNHVRQFCKAVGLPIDAFWGKANRFMTTAGPSPGRAWVLLRRGQVDQLDSSQTYDLVFDDGNGGQLTVKDLIFFQSTTVVPSYLDDPNGVCLCERFDVRWLAANPVWSNGVIGGSTGLNGTVIFDAFNVRAPAGGQYTYYVGSTLSGDGVTPWTWQQMCDNLWAAVNVAELGPSPALPFTPDGNPENFRFHGVSAYQAYNAVLRRLGCALSLDPTASQGARSFIYQIGGADPNLTIAEQKFIGLRKTDDDVQYGLRSRVPASANVMFQKFSEQYGTELTTRADASQWSVDTTTGPIYTINVQNPNAASNPSAEANSFAIIWDDLAARYDAFGNLTNQAALQSRANERAADYFRMIGFGMLPPMHRMYIGCIPDIGFMPGLQVNGYAVYDVGEGMLTEVHRFPPLVRVSDSGQWVDAWEDTLERLRPPDLGRATFPNYPPQVQLVFIKGVSPDAPNLYDGAVYIPDPTGFVYQGAEPCFVHVSLTANLTLVNGTYYLARLYGNHTGTPTGGGAQQTRPLYEVGALNSQFIVQTTAGATKVSGVNKITLDPAAVWLLTNPNPGEAQIDPGGVTASIAQPICTSVSCNSGTLSVTTMTFTVTTNKGIVTALSLA